MGAGNAADGAAANQAARELGGGWTVTPTRVQPDGTVCLRCARDGASVTLELAPHHVSRPALVRTPFGAVSYRDARGVDERTAVALGRHYAARLASGALALPARWPHLALGGVPADVLAKLYHGPAGAPAAAPARGALPSLDPEAVAALLAPELVPDGEPFAAGYVLRWLHAPEPGGPCRLEFSHPREDGSTAVVVLALGLARGEGTTTSPSPSPAGPFAVLGSLALWFLAPAGALDPEPAALGARLALLLALKNAHTMPAPARPAPDARCVPASARSAVVHADPRAWSEAMTLLGLFRSQPAHAPCPPELARLNDEIQAVHARFAPRLAQTVERELQTLAHEGLCAPDAPRPVLDFPREHAMATAAAIVFERACEQPARAQLLEEMYLDSNPRKWLRQLFVRAEPHETLFHTPLDWERLPRLRGMLERLFALVRDAGAPMEPFLGVPSVDALLAARAPTFAAVYDRAYWGRFMPLQDTGPEEVRALGALVRAGARAEPVLDDYCAAALFHDLTHGARGRVAFFPPHLEECCAVYLGVRAAPELLLPDPGTPTTLRSTSWYLQVGQALARTVGADALVRAYTGAVPWDRVVPPAFLRAVARLAWEDYFRGHESSFLARAFQPDAYLKLCYLAAAGADLSPCSGPWLDALPWRAVPPGPEHPDDALSVRDGLRAMCVAHRDEGGSVRVGRRVPQAPITLDLDGACALRTEATPGGCDAAPPAYLFPPPTAARLRARGVGGYALQLHRNDEDTLAAAARALFEGAASHHTDGYRLVTTGPPAPGREAP